MSSYFAADTVATERAGADFAKTLKGGETVALYGPLGAGKTTFVRGMASILCPDSAVTSPTYTIAHEYEGAIPIFHFDMYRIESFEELYNTGFFDYSDRFGVTVIEWSENIESALPEDCIRIKIFCEAQGRRIEVGI